MIWNAMNGKSVDKDLTTALEKGTGIQPESKNIIGKLGSCFKEPAKVI